MHVLLAEGEVAGGDHRREPVEHLEVGELELPRLGPVGLGRLAGEHGDDRALVTHGDAHDPDASLEPRALDVALDDFAALERLRDEWSLLGGAHFADEVGVVDRLARRRADVAEHDELVNAGRHIEHQVGEAEVGEHVPRRDEPAQVRPGTVVERRRLVQRHRWRPIWSRPATSAMSSSKYGTVTTAPGTFDSSMRCSASRCAMSR